MQWRVTLHLWIPSRSFSGKRDMHWGNNLNLFLVVT